VSGKGRSDALYHSRARQRPILAAVSGTAWRALVLAAALLAAAAAAGCGAGVTSGRAVPAESPLGSAPPDQGDGTAPGSAGTSGAEPSAGSRPAGELVLAFAGDVHFAERAAALLDDPATAFGPIRGVLAAADLAVVNLETAVTTGGTEQPKKYHFRAPATAYAAVKAAGVDAVSVANNHTLDYGPVGLADTLAAAAAAGVPAFGAGPSAAQAYAPWLTEVRGTRLAVLGFSQVHELETTWNATGERPGVAHARDRARAVAAVRAARAQADLVVVFMHWGREGSQCPTAEMVSFASAVAEAGADLIVGTHAHLLLGDGWLGRTYVAYGLGNFLWWWNDAYSNDTGVLRVTVRERRVAAAELVPAYISRQTGQPLPVTGAEAARITGKFAALRACTGLGSAP
jgi:poly-gamma-glutamate capsule biosynthesis protein CapA/YwtB (metallophosphatase superfamily)